MTYKNLISIDELAALLGEDAPLKLIDATYGPEAHSVYERAHLPNAVYADIDVIADVNAALPHTWPSVTDFETQVGALGVTPDDTVVIYAQTHMAMAAARLWWLFTSFGHKNVRVLNGSLRLWLAMGHPVTNEITSIKPTLYKAQPIAGRMTPVETLIQQQSNTDCQIVDARDALRFAQGHIPTSHNMPHSDVINGDGTLKPLDELRVIVEQNGLSPANPTIASCGSGVTACMDLLVLSELGFERLSLYDGSWTEYASLPHAPKNGLGF